MSRPLRTRGRGRRASAAAALLTVGAGCSDSTDPADGATTPATSALTTAADSPTGPRAVPEWRGSLASRDSAARHRADSDARVEADAPTRGDWRADVGAIVDVVGIDELFDQHFGLVTYRWSGWMPLKNSASSSDSAAGSSS